MAIDPNALIEELNTDLVAEVRGSGNIPLISVMQVKVKAVVRELISMRNYELSGMTDEEATVDLNRWYTQCLNVARYDYNQLGAEGEESHSENGISRKYVERERLWAGVIPFARVGGV